MKNKLPRLLADLNLYRLERGLSQARLAAQLGVTYQTVNRWFNGHFTPNAIQEFRIKKLLKGKA
jgi:transcriptional regulator with XRE-family HTH domain